MSYSYKKLKHPCTFCILIHALFAFSTKPDRISNFPHSILCNVLSFLSTKEAVATSVLSKRWNLLWRSVPSLDFVHPGGAEYVDEVACSRFLLSVHSFMFLRNTEQPIHRLRLRCFSNYNDYMFETCIKAAMRISGRLHHLDLNLPPVIAVPSVVFSCKTLVVLKLANLALKNISFVNFPLLKILHLNSVTFSEGSDLLQQFLSGSPNLEDLEVQNLIANPANKFNIFPKSWSELQSIRLEVTGFDFPNLVQLELKFVFLNKQWDVVLDLLNHCPKLQYLVIDILEFEIFPLAKGLEGAVLAYTQPVPTCISLHLKTCCIKKYSGFVVEFLFAKYIMQNANYLRTMKFCFDSLSKGYNNPLLRDAMIRDLSSCRKRSYICTLSFE
uniref:Cyclin-like F-box n=1 Tax=Phaseolus vulgaris TaxID=3885 RepID=D2DW93_PHAVU|nr:cyclin-like F-box [Phaseolus vulgaris]